MLLYMLLAIHVEYVLEPTYHLSSAVHGEGEIPKNRSFSRSEASLLGKKNRILSCKSYMETKITKCCIPPCFLHGAASSNLFFHHQGKVGLENRQQLQSIVVTINRYILLFFLLFLITLTQIHCGAALCCIAKLRVAIGSIQLVKRSQFVDDACHIFLSCHGRNLCICRDDAVPSIDQSCLDAPD